MKTTENPPPLDVLVVGGGFSGAMVAVHLLRRCENLCVGILDRGTHLGRGLAYSSPRRFHLLNVPAAKMSALPDEPEHFLRWAQRNYGASVQARSFLPRTLYGDYVSSLFAETVQDRSQNRVFWVQDEGLSIREEAARVVVERKTGLDLVAHVVVLAIGNFPPADPQMAGLSASSSLYRPLAWGEHPLDDIPAGGSVLLIGSGLTSIDLVMALKSKCFEGTIHVLSRKGLLPRRHKPSSPWPLYWHENSPRTTRELLRLIRVQIEEAATRGVNWRSVIDCLRPVTQQIWQSLPREEKRRFLRHLRSHWEVHRHRLAPEIADVLSDMKAEGQVHFHAGRVIRYRERGSIATVSYRDRYTRRKKSVKVNRVINCTGSETDCRRIDDSLISSLFAQGLARPDPLFLGLDTDGHGALLGYDGRPSTSLFTLGPARKGSLWETTAVPEIRFQAAQLGEHLSHVLQARVPARDALEKAV